MSVGEWKRLEAVERIEGGGLTVKRAGELLGLSFPCLAEHFVDLLNERMVRCIAAGIDDAAVEAMERMRPGNVRELFKVISL